MYRVYLCARKSKVCLNKTLARFYPVGVRFAYRVPGGRPSVNSPCLASNKSMEIQMRVKFNFSSHDSPEVLRLAASFLTTLSDLAPESSQTTVPSAEGERVLFRRHSPFELPVLKEEYAPIPTEAPQEDAPAKKKRAAAKAVEETSTDLGQSPSAPIAGATPTVGLTEVRALLAEKSRTGKRTEVQALIAEYGVGALTDIPADKLTEVYSKGIAI